MDVLFRCQICALGLTFSVQMRYRMRLNLSIILKHILLFTFQVLVVILRHDLDNTVGTDGKPRQKERASESDNQRPRTKMSSSEVN